MRRGSPVDERLVVAIEDAVSMSTSHLDGGVSHFGEVAVDSLDAGEVTDTRLSAKAGQGHHVDGDIEATELYGPLSCSNHGLVDPGVFRVEEF